MIDHRLMKLIVNHNAEKEKWEQEMPHISLCAALVKQRSPYPYTSLIDLPSQYIPFALQTMNTVINTVAIDLVQRNMFPVKHSIGD